MAKYFFNQFIDMITSRLHFQNFILGGMKQYTYM